MNRLLHLLPWATRRDLAEAIVHLQGRNANLEGRLEKLERCHACMVKPPRKKRRPGKDDGGPWDPMTVPPLPDLEVTPDA